MKLSAEARSSVDECVLCWLATSSRDACPNVSPKEIFAVYRDESIIIANIASPKSARNIKENSLACVSFVNVFTQRGFKVVGAAECVKESDQGYQEMKSILVRQTEGMFPFKSIFRVMVHEESRIVAPRYQLFPETTQEQQIASSMKAYRVVPDDYSSE